MFERRLIEKLAEALQKELKTVDMPECKHEYEHQETIKKTGFCGYNILYIRKDIYFCKFCLKIKEIIKKECLEEVPIWF